MKKILKLLNMKYGELTVCLVFGFAYFAVILNFILKNTQRAGLFLGFITAPAVICGLALIFIKALRRWKENEQYKNIMFFMIINTIILIFSILTLISNLIYGV